jgi:hypothetical protein
MVLFGKSVVAGDASEHFGRELEIGIDVEHVVVVVALACVVAVAGQGFGSAVFSRRWLFERRVGC